MGVNAGEGEEVWRGEVRGDSGENLDGNVGKNWTADVWNSMLSFRFGGGFEKVWILGVGL